MAHRALPSVVPSTSRRSPASSLLPLPIPGDGGRHLSSLLPLAFPLTLHLRSRAVRSGGGARGGGSAWGGDAAARGPATAADAAGWAWDPVSSGDGLRRWARMRRRRLGGGHAQPSSPHSGAAPVPFPILQGSHASGAARPAYLWSATPLMWPSRRK
ncbi:unnamed protein product [Urochloa humidicola]